MAKPHVRRTLTSLALLAALFAPPLLVSARSVPAAQPTADCTARPAAGMFVTSTPDGLTLTDVATTGIVAEASIGPVSSLLPTSDPTVAFARTPNGLYLVDGSAGTVTLLDIPAAIAGALIPSAQLTRGAAGLQRMVLADPTTSHAYLFDLATGSVTDLAPLLPGRSKGAGYVGQMTVTAGDGWVLIWDGQQVYRVDAANPVEAVPLGGSAFTYAPDASSNGTEVVFGRRTATGGSEVLVQPLASDDPEIIFTSDDAVVPLWIPQRRALLLDQRSMTDGSGALSYLDLETGEESTLIGYTGAVMAVQFSTSGEQALIAVDKPGSRQIYLADFSDLTIKLVPAAKSLNPTPGLYDDADWAFFSPNTDIGLGVEGMSYGGMALAGGEFVTFSAQDPNVTYSAPIVTRDGSRALVTSVDARGETLWLFDTPAATARILVTSGGIVATFSPDGCWVAAAVDGEILAYPVAGGEPLSFGSGERVLWLPSQS